jgi:mRNA interferase MazF
MRGDLWRGEIWRVRAPRDAVGHEQRGARFAVIVQSNDLQRLSTVLLAPTSTNAQASGFRPEIVVRDARTLVLLDQIKAVDVEKALDTYIGRVSPDELADINAGLRTVFDLYR